MTDSSGHYLFSTIAPGSYYVVFGAPDNYGFSRKFGWVNDRFGVSWQVNLPRQS